VELTIVFCALELVAMEEVGILGKTLQSQITDFFHTLHVPLTEPKTYCPFHQFLITDYFHKIDFSIVFFESFFDDKSTIPIPVLSETVSQAFTYTLSDIPSSEPQTLVSKFIPSDSSFTHVS